MLRDLCLVGDDDAQVAFDDLFRRYEAGLGGGSHAVEVAAHLHVELDTFVAGLLQEGEPVVGLGQVRVVARALELQGTKTILSRLVTTSNMPRRRQCTTVRTMRC